jgi:hypothetical protein
MKNYIFRKRTSKFYMAQSDAYVWPKFLCSIYSYIALINLVLFTV